MKKLAILLVALVLAMTLCCSALAESKTYTHFFPAEELAGTTDLNGFISAMAMTQLNTVELKDDGTYVYTKLLGTLDENHEPANMVQDGAELRAVNVLYTFTGTYTQEGVQVVLNIPETCEFSEDWGALYDIQALQNSAGTAANDDRVRNYEGWDHSSMEVFTNPVYKYMEPAAVTITLNDDGTFDYVAAANSDDE